MKQIEDDDSIGNDSFDLELQEEIEDIKSRKYFIVPPKLACDRYVNLIKLLKHRKQEINYDEFLNYSKLEFIEPNLEYLNSHFQREGLGTLDKKGLESKHKSMISQSDDQELSKEDIKRKKLEDRANNLFENAKNVFVTNNIEIKRKTKS